MEYSDDNILQGLDASVAASDMTDDGQEASADPVKGLHAAKPKDFIIFINLVDFSK